MRSHSKDRLGVLATIAGSAIVGGWITREALRRSRRFDLRGSVAVVSGGSRGLGLAVARQLVREGAKVAIGARDQAELDAARAQLQALGGDVMAVAFGVDDRASAAGFIDEVIRRWGAVHVLINNAAVIQVGPASTMSVEDYEQAMRTNFFGQLYTVDAALPIMRQQGFGRIVNIASFGGKVAAPHLLPYTASKFAVVGWSEGLRVELASENIAVSCVCPGLVTTGSPRNADFKGQADKEYAWFAAGDGAPRVAMNADRLAKRVVDAARFGDGEITVPFNTKLLTLVHGISPNLFAAASTVINRFLPSAGGVGTQSVKGHDSDSLEPSITHSFNAAAAAANNEM